MNLGVPIVNNMGMELSRKNEQGLVNALLMITWTSSWMVATALGGYMIDEYGYTFTMHITIVLYVLSAVSYYAFFRKAEIRNSDTPGWTLIHEHDR